MEFSPQDEDLVEIIEAVGEIAAEINTGGLGKEEKKAKRFYIDTLIKRYFSVYRDMHNAVPSKSLFSEAINWYIDENFRNNINLSGIIKSLARELVLQPYEKYRKQTYINCRG